MSNQWSSQLSYLRKIMREPVGFSSFALRICVILYPDIVDFRSMQAVLLVSTAVGPKESKRV